MRAVLMYGLAVVLGIVQPPPFFIGFVVKRLLFFLLFRFNVAACLAQIAVVPLLTTDITIGMRL